MRSCFALCLSTVLLAGPVMAQDIQTQIAQQLRAQGFDSVEISKTWLGRLRFEGSDGTQRREIIVNPRTGEILRDFLSSEEGSDTPSVQILDRSAPDAVNRTETRGAPSAGSDNAPAVGGGNGAGSGPDTGAAGPSR